MIDRSTPQQRARFNEYFGAMERRMREQGIQPGGGPRR
jgi:Spy/CpxP family protein refolding chaperone